MIILYIKLEHKDELHGAPEGLYTNEVSDLDFFLPNIIN